MAHFARLDENNIVIEVIVVHNNELLDNGVESENKGIQFCQNIYGGNWKQTSYNGSFRKNFAGTGSTYDSVRDAFIPPKMYEEQVFNEETCRWEFPRPETPPE